MTPPATEPVPATEPDAPRESGVVERSSARVGGEDSGRYTKRVLLYVLLGLVVTAAINALVDPYAIFGRLHVHGLNASRPEERYHDRLHHAYAVRRVAPDAVLLGTSRTQVGMDPHAPAFRGHAERVLNLALSAGTTYEARRYLEHAQSVHPLRFAALGLDFLSFDARTDRRNDEFSEARLDVDDAGHANPLAFAADWSSALLSFSALKASAKTVLRQNQPSYFDDDGLRTTRFMEARLDEAGGMRANMIDSEREYLDDFALYRPTLGDGTSPGLEDLARLVAFARAQHIALYLFFSPSHARDLLAIRAAGLGDAYEHWKRRVVAIAQDAGTGTSTTVWDFSGANRYTSEAVPPGADHDARMHWYWESSHYRAELGNLVAERLMGAAERDATRGFGAVLTRDNVEREVLRVRAELDAYAAAHPDEIAEIARSRDERFAVSRARAAALLR